MFTAVSISDDTTPVIRKILNDFYLGFERQYWSLFRSLNEWTLESLSFNAGGYSHI